MLHHRMPLHLPAEVDMVVAFNRILARQTQEAFEEAKTQLLDGIPCRMKVSLCLSGKMKILLIFITFNSWDYNKQSDISGHNDMANMM